MLLKLSVRFFYILKLLVILFGLSTSALAQDYIRVEGSDPAKNEYAKNILKYGNQHLEDEKYQQMLNKNLEPIKDEASQIEKNVVFPPQIKAFQKLALIKNVKKIKVDTVNAYYRKHGNNLKERETWTEWNNIAKKRLEQLNGGVYEDVVLKELKENYKESYESNSLENYIKRSELINNINSQLKCVKQPKLFEYSHEYFKQLYFEAELKKINTIPIYLKNDGVSSHHSLFFEKRDGKLEFPQIGNFINGGETALLESRVYLSLNGNFNNLNEKATADMAHEFGHMEMSIFGGGTTERGYGPDDSHFIGEILTGAAAFNEGYSIYKEFLIDEGMIETYTLSKYIYEVAWDENEDIAKLKKGDSWWDKLKRNKTYKKISFSDERLTSDILMKTEEINARILYQISKNLDNGEEKIKNVLENHASENMTMKDFLRFFAAEYNDDGTKEALDKILKDILTDEKCDAACRADIMGIEDKPLNSEDGEAGTWLYNNPFKETLKEGIELQNAKNVSDPEPLPPVKPLPKPQKQPPIKPLPKPKPIPW